MDPSDWKAMRLIAQRMNGFQGSFGFLPDDLEYKFNIRELAELAELITDYFAKKKLPIGESELAILNESLDSLEKVMLLLKERKPLDEEFINDISLLLMKGTDLDFEEKEKLDQNDIDSLLDDLF